MTAFDPTTDVDWKSTVFLLIGPDAVARHLAGPILERAAGIGLTPAWYHVLPFPHPDLDRLYEHHIRDVWDAYRFRLVDLLFAFGPMVAVLLRDDGGDGDPHHRFKRIKGDSDPAKAAPGTIRHDLGSINVTMSLVHASDSPEAAATEVPHFLDGAVPVAAAAGDVEKLCRLMAPGPAETRGFDEVLSGVRAKVIAAAWADIDSTGRDVVLQTVAGGDLLPLAAPGFGARVVSHLRGGDAHPAATMLEGEFVPGERRLDVSRLRSLAGGLGVTIDRWEELVLTTSTTWAPRRSHGG